MLNLDKFNGHFFDAPYEVRHYRDLVDNIVEEIIFYGSGFGWASSGIKIRKKNPDETHIKVAILFPYINQSEEHEPQSAFLSRLMKVVRKELRRYITTGRIMGVNYQAIDGFEYGVTRVAKDIHQFALVLKK